MGLGFGVRRQECWVPEGLPCWDVIKHAAHCEIMKHEEV